MLLALLICRTSNGTCAQLARCFSLTVFLKLFPPSATLLRDARARSRGLPLQAYLAVTSELTLPADACTLTFLDFPDWSTSRSIEGMDTSIIGEPPPLRGRGRAGEEPGKSRRRAGGRAEGRAEGTSGACELELGHEARRLPLRSHSVPGWSRAAGWLQSLRRLRTEGVSGVNFTGGAAVAVFHAFNIRGDGVFKKKQQKNATKLEEKIPIS